MSTEHRLSPTEFWAFSTKDLKKDLPAMVAKFRLLWGRDAEVLLVPQKCAVEIADLRSVSFSLPPNMYMLGLKEPFDT